MLKNKLNNLILCLCLIILVLGSSGNPIFARYLTGGERQKIDSVTGKPVFDKNGKPVMERTNGFQEIASDAEAIAELPTNVPLALRRVNTAIGDVGNVAANTATGKISVGEAVDLVGNVKIGKLRDQKEAENKNNEIADNVNNLLGNNAENARETLKTEANNTTETLGGSNTNANGTKRETYVYDEIMAPNQTMMTPDGQIINKNEAAAITETQSKDIGFDMRNTDLQNGVEVQKITTHEASHRAGYGEGASALLGDVAADVWTEQNKVNNRTTNTATDPVATQANFLANPANAATLQTGNDKVSSITQGQPDVYLAGKRKVPFPGPDVDVHLGAEIMYGTLSNNLGTDGKSLNLNINPNIAGSVYFNVNKHNSISVANASFGFNKIISGQVNFNSTGKPIGGGVSFGLGLNPIPINASMSTEVLTRKGSK